MSSLSPDVAAFELPGSRLPWPADLTEAQAEAQLARAFAAAVDTVGTPVPPATCTTATLVLEAAVRGYVVRCKADGLPPERALVRLGEVTRRHVFGSQHQQEREALSANVFRIFLSAYYGR